MLWGRPLEGEWSRSRMKKANIAIQKASLVAEKVHRRGLSILNFLGVCGLVVDDANISIFDVIND